MRSRSRRTSSRCRAVGWVPPSLTQNRILGPTPSRKSAFCAGALTKNRILGPTPSRKSALRVIGTMQNAPFGNATPAECVFP